MEVEGADVERCQQVNATNQLVGGSSLGQVERINERALFSPERINNPEPPLCYQSLFFPCSTVTPNTILQDCPHLSNTSIEPCIRQPNRPQNLRCYPASRVRMSISLFTLSLSGSPQTGKIVTQLSRVPGWKSRLQFNLISFI